MNNILFLVILSLFINSIFAYNIPFVRLIWYQKKHINFIIWKGYNKQNENYFNFSKNLIKIGKKNNIIFNISISDNYNLEKISSNTILFGHSAGGYKCLEYNNSKLLAKIVYGATHNSYNKIKFANKIEKDRIPTLTMIGEKDGFLPSYHLIDEMIYNYKFNKTNQTVIRVNNTNHLCICDNKVGILSKLLNITDNNLDFDINLMLNTISNTIINYINLQNSK